MPERPDCERAGEAVRTGEDIDVQINGAKPIECLEEDAVARANEHTVIPKTRHRPIGFFEQRHVGTVGTVGTGAAAMTRGWPRSLDGEHMLRVAPRSDDDMIADSELANAPIVVEQQMHACGVGCGRIAEEVIDIDEVQRPTRGTTRRTGARPRRHTN